MRNIIRVVRVVAGAIAIGLLAMGSLALAHTRGRGESHKAHYSAWDKQWLKGSIEGDRFEVAGGKLAQDKGTNDAVRNLGKRLESDHSKSLEEAIALAHKLGISVPRDPTPSQQWELKVVGSKSGADFDKWYSDLEVQDHIQDIQEAKDEVSDGSNSDVRRDAKKEIPTLKQHLKLSRAALAQSG